jgi:hypothetical protein
MRLAVAVEEDDILIRGNYRLRVRMNYRGFGIFVQITLSLPMGLAITSSFRGNKGNRSPG